MNAQSRWIAAKTRSKVKRFVWKSVSLSVSALHGEMFLFFVAETVPATTQLLMTSTALSPSFGAISFAASLSVYSRALKLYWAVQTLLQFNFSAPNDCLSRATGFVHFGRCVMLRLKLAVLSLQMPPTCTIVYGYIIYRRNGWHTLATSFVLHTIIQVFARHYLISTSSCCDWNSPLLVVQDFQLYYYRVLLECA